MREPSEFDLAQLKHELRQIYRDVGDDKAVHILHEMMIGARLLTEVIVEERYRHEAN